MCSVTSVSSWSRLLFCRPRPEVVRVAPDSVTVVGFYSSSSQSSSGRRRADKQRDGLPTKQWTLSLISPAAQRPACFFRWVCSFLLQKSNLLRLTQVNYVILWREGAVAVGEERGASILSFVLGHNHRWSVWNLRTGGSSDPITDPFRSISVCLNQETRAVSPWTPRWNRGSGAVSAPVLPKYHFSWLSPLSN